MISEYINRRDVQNILSKYYPDAGPTTEQILHNINRDIKSIPDADVVTWEQLKKAWAIATADDVAPVVHGGWVQLNGHRYCNVCGHKDSPILTKYCPNCGAKMDGGADNGKS